MQQTQSPKAGARTHTPGPWLTYGPSITADDPTAPGYTVQIARLGSLSDNTKGDPVVVEANARLIAAAPELLEACVRLLPIIGKLSVVGGYIKCRIKPHDADSFHSTYSRLRAAIAKVEGTNLALAQHEAEEQETEHQLAGNGNITED